MKHGSRNTGFALLIVLLVITVAATALGTSVRNSCQQAIRAGRVAMELQVRWGAISCKAVFLPAAETILQELSAAGGGAVVNVRRDITLGSVKFQLIVSDEQAKANVNFLASRRGQRGLVEGIRQLQTDLRLVLPVRLRPAEPKISSKGPTPEVYTSFDQLLAVEHPSRLIMAKGFDKLITDRITCWSDGKVNFKRAEQGVLRQMLTGLLTEYQINQLLRIRLTSPQCRLREAMSQLELSRENAKQVEPLLTDTSLCHGLWVVAQGLTRNWYQFYAAREDESGENRQEWLLQW
ncbi:MAG: hypothetical protein HQ546_01190 [Planctomycetes bacterium]|nr:hypothetical protein [Planctomycetota bacterium]